MKQQARRTEAAKPTGHRERASAGPTGEQVTVLCCRIVAVQDGVELPRPIRPDLLQAYRARIDQVVLRFHGYVMQEQPQRLWACFGNLPGGHDGARRAMLAGVELSSVAEQLAGRERPQSEVAFCIGVHTGRIALGDSGTVDDQGSADLDKLIALATQMADEAGTRGVVASEATFREAQAHFRFRELDGGTRVGGGARLTRLYEAFELPADGMPSARAEPAAYPTPLCGRQAELEFLLRCWQQTVRGESPVAVLTGAAGIGKTRVVRALKDSLVLEPHEVLECGCSELLRSTSLHPIVELLEERLALTREHGAAQRLERLQAELLDASNELEQVLPLFAALLSIPGPGRSADQSPASSARIATLDAVIAWLRALAARAPTLLIVEDLQWADASTLELLTRLIAAGPQRGLMLVVTHRPEFTLPWASSRLWELVLSPLPPRAAARLVASVSRTRPLSGEMVRELLEQAEGVPLFLEELTKACLDSRAPQPREVLPEPASDSLSRRFAGLGPSRATLQLGAVLGQKFRLELLAAVSDQAEPVLRNHLQKLVEMGLWLRQQSAAEETYAFKHALLQEAAYEAMPRRTARAYHQRVAQTIVEQFPDIAQSQPEFLARQFAAGDQPARAVDHWARAGDAAAQRCAFGEAVHAYSQALEQLNLLPTGDGRDRREVELRIGRGLALISMLGYAAPEVEDNYSHALELCERLSNVSFGVLYGIWCVFLVRSDGERAQRLTRSIERILEHSSDPLVQLCAQSALGTHARFAGDHRTAQLLVDRAAQHYDLANPAQQLARVQTQHGYDGYMFPWIYGASSRLLRGNLAEGWSLGLRALELAEATQHPYALAMTLGALSNWASDIVGDCARGRDYASREMALALEHGFAFWDALSSAHAGFAEIRLGNIEIGLSQLNSSIEKLQKLAGVGPVLHAQQFLAEGYLVAGDAEQALRVSDDMLRNGRGQLAGIYLPWALRVNGAALAALGDAASAETRLRESIALSHAQDARLYELRAAVCLGGVLRDSGRAREAGALVRPLCAGLTGGDDWPDLRAARTLLAEV